MTYMFVAWQCCQKAREPWRNVVYTLVYPARAMQPFYFTLQILFSTVIPFILIVKLAFTNISLVWLIVYAFSKLLKRENFS